MKNRKPFIAARIAVLFIITGTFCLIVFNTGYRVVAKNSLNQPQSFMEIYKGFRMIYKFAPIVPESIGYPRTLNFEKAQRLGPYLITSWGETGADYFGSHPIVIGCSGEKCKAVNIYNHDLSGDARIKDYSWTRKDFFITNYFDPSEKAKTILTQGVEISPDKYLELIFYADEKPHASEHKYAKIKIFSLK